MVSSPRGLLIALEGTRGPELADTARKLVRHICRGKIEGGVSGWDASSIFYELRKGDYDGPNPSPRTLLLLYASDLAFRLRWEIRPAIEEGMCVVAAPYVESAVAFGKAAGISRRWLVDLFSFAPKPSACYRLKERREGAEWRVKRSEGFLEFCCKTLIKGSPAWNASVIHGKFIDYLEALEKRGSCGTLTEKLLAGISADKVIAAVP